MQHVCRRPARHKPAAGRPARSPRRSRCADSRRGTSSRFAASATSSARTCAAALQDRGAAVLHRMAAGGVAFVRRCSSVSAVTSFSDAKGNVELFGGDLLERGLDALSEFGLAGEHRDRCRRHRCGSRNRDTARSSRLPGELRRRRRCRRGLILRERVREREADDQRAAAGEQPAATRMTRGVHRALPCLPGELGRVHQPRRALHRAQDAHMRAAAAEIGLAARRGSASSVGLRIASAAAPAPASSCRRCNSRIAPPALR